MVLAQVEDDAFAVPIKVKKKLQIPHGDIVHKGKITNVGDFAATNGIVQ